MKPNPSEDEKTLRAVKYFVRLPQDPAEAAKILQEYDADCVGGDDSGSDSDSDKAKTPTPKYRTKEQIENHKKLWYIFPTLP